MQQGRSVAAALEGSGIPGCVGREQAPSEPSSSHGGLLQAGDKAWPQEQQQTSSVVIEPPAPTPSGPASPPQALLHEGFTAVAQAPMCRFCLEEEDEDEPSRSFFFSRPAAAATCSGSSGATQDVESQRLLGHNGSSSCTTHHHAASHPPAAYNWVTGLMARLQQGKHSSVPEPTKPHQQQRRRRKNPLIAPCLCTGSSKYVHVACLQKWRDSSPAAFSRCTVCGYEYRFKQTRAAACVRSSAVAPLALVALLVGLCWALGYLPAFKPDDSWLLHFLNGFVMVGLTGFVVTLADLFSNRRAVALLAWLEEWVGHELSVAYTYLAISMFQLLAVAMLIICLVLSSLWSWGVVILAALGLNQLSCGPLLSGLRKCCDSIAGRLDMQTSRMIVQAVAPYPAPRRVELQQRQGLPPCAASPVSVLAASSSSTALSCCPSPSVLQPGPARLVQVSTDPGGSSGNESSHGHGRVDKTWGERNGSGSAVRVSTEAPEQEEQETAPLLQVVVQTDQPGDIEHNSNVAGAAPTCSITVNACDSDSQGCDDTEVTPLRCAAGSQA